MVNAAGERTLLFIRHWSCTRFHRLDGADKISAFSDYITSCSINIRNEPAEPAPTQSTLD